MTLNAIAETTHSRSEPNIDWSYSGRPDPMAGNGATPIEQAVLWTVGAMGAAAMIILAAGGWVSWNWWETALGALIGFDLIGGAAAGALNTSKRFYFTPVKDNERGPLRLLKSDYYLPLISVHPLLVYLLYKPSAFTTGILIYAGVAAAAITTRRAPLYLARPLATLSLILAILVNSYLIRPIPGFEWMLPILTLKLVMGYSCREEPYRPA